MKRNRKELVAAVGGIEVVIAIKHSEEEHCFYAWSPQLSCIRDGNTVEEALALCREALEVLFESLLERGSLDAHLIRHGYIGSDVDVDGQPHRCYALKSGSLVPQPTNKGAKAFTNMPIYGLYKDTVHPTAVHVGA